MSITGLVTKEILCKTVFITKNGTRLPKVIELRYHDGGMQFDEETEMLTVTDLSSEQAWEKILYGVWKLTKQLKEHDTSQTTVSDEYGGVFFEKRGMTMYVVIDASDTSRALHTIHTNNLSGIGETRGASIGNVKRSVHYHFDKRFLGGRGEDDELITAALQKIDRCNQDSGETIDYDGEHITLVYVCEIIMADNQEQGSDTSSVSGGGGSQSVSESRMGRHAMSAYRCDLAVALSTGDGKKLQKLQEQAPPGTGAAVGALTPVTPTAGADAQAAYGLDKFATLSLAERASQYTTACARLQEHHKKRPGDIAAHMDTYVSYISPMADHIPKALHKGARDIFA